MAESRRSLAASSLHACNRYAASGEIEDVGEMSSHTGKKEEAVEAGRELAQARRTEHVIHDLEGRIAERN